MRYTVEITVDVPRDEFIKKLDNPENMKHWQKGLLSYEQISGKPGSEGAQMGLSYQFGKRKMEMVETIIKNDMPNELHASYDTKGVQNIQKNYFEEVDGKTVWKSDNTFEVVGAVPVVDELLSTAGDCTPTGLYLCHDQNLSLH